jgi:hypothetical protein
VAFSENAFCYIKIATFFSLATIPIETTFASFVLGCLCGKQLSVLEILGRVIQTSVCGIGNCAQDAPTKLTYVVLHILMKQALVQDRFGHESRATPCSHLQSRFSDCPQYREIFAFVIFSVHLFIVNLEANWQRICYVYLYLYYRPHRLVGSALKPVGCTASVMSPTLSAISVCYARFILQRT